MKHTRPPLVPRFPPRFDPLPPHLAARSPARSVAVHALLASCLLLGGALLPATAGEPPASVLAQASAASQQPSTPPGTARATPKVQQFTLANGLTLIVKPDHRAPTAVHMLWVRVGAMDEVDGTSGVAHVLEHMLFKGTPTVKAGEFSRRVAALGGRENAFTARDYTGYYQQIPAQHLGAVMALEADRFANNQWPDDAFVKELEVVKEERRMRTEESPHARLSEAMMAMVYQAHPYHRPIVGWMSDLDAMTPDDARAFFKRWYTPANAAVVVAGDVDVAQVRALAEKTYGRIKARPVPPRKPREEPAQHGMRRLDFKAPAEQAFVTLAFKVPGLDVRTLAQPRLDAAGQDALALTVLSAVLDGYDGARLDRALTQPADHVADSAGSHYGLTGRGPQLFMLQGVPASGKTAAQVEQALREQVQRIAREGVTEAELHRVKTQWVAGEVYRQDSVFNQAQTLGANWVQGAALDADERLIAHLRGVTAAQVQVVAQRYFGDDALTVATLLPQPMDKTPQPRVPKAGSRH
ncbi:MAG: insulinase family protein [Burkholderiales bacterium]|nr:insulinase family protein [Burkholderiales bacterium]